MAFSTLRCKNINLNHKIVCTLEGESFPSHISLLQTGVVGGIYAEQCFQKQMNTLKTSRSLDLSFNGGTCQSQSKLESDLNGSIAGDG